MAVLFLVIGFSCLVASGSSRNVLVLLADDAGVVCSAADDACPVPNLRKVILNYAAGYRQIPGFLSVQGLEQAKIITSSRHDLILARIFVF